MPILFISARTSDDDVIIALNIGGDDYIKKPFTLNVLFAKVKAILARYEKAKEAAELAAQSQTPEPPSQTDGSRLFLRDGVYLDTALHKLEDFVRHDHLPDDQIAALEHPIWLPVYFQISQGYQPGDTFNILYRSDHSPARTV